MKKPELMYDKLMTPAEVSEVFNADPRSIARWAKKGLLPHIRTIGGHRRYLKSAVLELLGGKMPGKLYTVGEVAKMLKMSPKTVARWDREGKLTSVRTPGNHRRIIATEVDALLSTWRRD